MSTDYKPKNFWERRLSEQFSLSGVGHIGFTESYNRWLYRRKKRCIEACWTGTDLAGTKVLDVGCGTGFFVDWYLSQGAEVCGIDITRVSVQKLKERFPCEFYTQDITDGDYQLKGREFDIVNMWDVIYHIVDPERFHQALDNIQGNLKDGGLFLFTDWFGASEEALVADHVRARPLGTYQECLPVRGFELVGIYPLYNYLNKPHLGRIDNYLGAFYKFLDDRSRKISKDNLSLSLWRFHSDNVVVI